MSLATQLASSSPGSEGDLQFDSNDRALLDLVGRSSPDSIAAWRLNGEAHQLSLVRGFDELVSRASLRGVVRYEYQERAALRVLRELRGRAILADEVGLGKTVEAGLILKEYAVRGLVRTALVLAPPALQGQWREEMREKFGLPFELVGSPADWGQRPFLVASLDAAKREPQASGARAVAWDLVIVDEAHRLKNRDSRNWRFVVGLHKKYMLLLTATPIQNDLDELFNLVSLLKPGQLHTYEEFLTRYVASPDRRVPNRVPELRGLLRNIMIRNRRGIAFTLPPRRVRSIPVRLSAGEQRLYDDVTEFVRDTYGRADGRLPWTAKLTLTVLQREIGSSSFAAAHTLAKMAASPLFSSTEQGRLSALHAEAESVRENVKARHVLVLLHSIDEKALVFTQYVRTLRYLQARLEAEGFRVAAYHGGMTAASKDAAVRSFRDEAQIFLSTEAGGEGRNLQFARTLVNYDLPWNPLRIEQRIGRVHRMGQGREVHVVNLWAERTVEELLIELLDRKIHLFELVVGELDLILGSLDPRMTFEELLMDLWVLREEEARRDAVEHLAHALKRAQSDYEDVREKNSSILDGSPEEVIA
jgi:SNF2 family DNA or RNA helicase